MTTQDHGVPQYFADFVRENARQHQELSERIGSVHTELGERIGSVHTELSERIGSVYAELSAQIAEVKGELKIIKLLSVGIFIAVGASAIKYMFGL